MQRQLDAALSIQRQLEAQISQFQSADAEFQIVREQLTAAQEKHGLLEAQVADLGKARTELTSVKTQLHEALQGQQKLSAEVSRLQAKEAELSKDLAEKQQIQGQLTARVSDLLKAEVDPDQVHKLLETAASSEIQKLRDDLEKATKELQEKDAEIQQAIEQLEGSSDNPQEVKQEFKNKDIKIRGLLDENDTLMAKIKEKTDERAVMASTLNSVLGLVQTVLAFNPRISIRTPLEDARTLIQGRLNLGTGTRRARDDDDDGAEDARPARRARVENSIELD